MWHWSTEESNPKYYFGWIDGINVNRLKYGHSFIPQASIHDKQLKIDSKWEKLVSNYIKKIIVYYGNYIKEIKEFKEGKC